MAGRGEQLESAGRDGVGEGAAGLGVSDLVAVSPQHQGGDAATEYLLCGVLRYQGAVRAMISATIIRPEAAAASRPGIRFGLIEYALAPLDGTLPAGGPDTLAQLKRDLAVVVSAEALFTLTDLCVCLPTTRSPARYERRALSPRRQPAPADNPRAARASPPSGAPFPAQGDPQRVLRRVGSRPRRDRVGVRPVKLIKPDAIEGDARVVSR